MLGDVFSVVDLVILKVKFIKMLDKTHKALDKYALLPRLLHQVKQADMTCHLLEQAWPHAILPYIGHGQHSSVASEEALSLIDMTESDATRDSLKHQIPLIALNSMGKLVAEVKKLQELNPAAIALDLRSSLTTQSTKSSYTFSKEELAELGAVASCPLWLYGVASPADAETAAEAGIDAIVVTTDAYSFLATPATIDVFSEIYDFVAGSLTVLAAGQLRDGIDAFRYLAVGAEAVIMEGDQRSLAQLRMELANAMRLTGCETLADIGYEAIYAPLFEEF